MRLGCGLRCTVPGQRGRRGLILLAVRRVDDIETGDATRDYEKKGMEDQGPIKRETENVCAFPNGVSGRSPSGMESKHSIPILWVR